jgi:hypothetical protein
VGQSPALATALLACVYLGMVAVSPPGGYYITDQGIKILQVDALVRTGSFDLASADAPASIFRAEFTHNAPFAIVGDSYQSAYPVAFAAVAALFYWAFGQAAVVGPPVIGALLAAYFSGRSGALLGLRLPGLLALVVGLASPLLFYSLVLYEQALSTGLLCLAVYLALSRRPFSAGVCVGIAFWIRPEACLFTLALAAAQLLRWGGPWPFGWFVIRLGTGSLAAAAPFVVYNLVTFGGPLGPHVTGTYEASGGPPTLSGLDVHLAMLRAYFEPAGLKKWLATLAAMPARLLVLRRRRRRLELALWAFYLAVAGIMVVNVIGGDFVADSVTDGFPLAFAAIASLALVRRDPQVRFLWGLTVLFSAAVFLTAPSTPKWDPGWAARYLLPAYPLLGLLAWTALSLHRATLARVALVALLASSLAVQAVGVRILWREQERWTRLTAELTALEPRVMATPVWWVPMVTPLTLRDTRWYGVVDRRDVEHVVAQSERFWWIWGPVVNGRGREFAGPLAIEGITPLAEKALSSRGLKATLYRVERRGARAADAAVAAPVQSGAEPRATDPAPDRPGIKSG